MQTINTENHIKESEEIGYEDVNGMNSNYIEPVKKNNKSKFIIFIAIILIIVSIIIYIIKR